MNSIVSIVGSSLMEEEFVKILSFTYALTLSFFLRKIILPRRKQAIPINSLEVIMNVTCREVKRLLNNDSICFLRD